MKNMKNFGKRSLSVLLALVMCLGMLNLTVFAVEGEPDCGIEAHTHSVDAGCYALICGVEAGDGAVAGHTHTDECYDMVEVPGAYICEAAGEDHEHTEACPRADSTFVRGELKEAHGEVEAVEGHTHKSECYAAEPDCGREEHAHDEACFVNPDEAAVILPTCATVDEFMSAVAAIEDAGDLESTLAMLDSIDAIYNRLSDEDRAAVEMYYEMVQSYRQDPGLSTLTTYTIRLQPTGSYAGSITGVKVKVGDKIGYGNYTVSQINGKVISLQVSGNTGNNFYLPSSAALWTGAMKADKVYWTGMSAGYKQEGAPAILPSAANVNVQYYFDTANSVSSNTKTFTLNYNANGGKDVPPKQTGTGTGSSYTFTISTIQPNKSGYRFVGYSTSSSAICAEYTGANFRTEEEYINHTIVVTGTTTLYAIWNPCVRYFGNGADSGEVKPTGGGDAGT